MENEKKAQKNIFSSATTAKDFRIHSKNPKNNLMIETSSNVESNPKIFNSTKSEFINPILHSPSSVMKFRKTINLFSTPKISAMAKVNPENKFERIFLSMDRHSTKFEEEENEEYIKKKLNDSFELEIEDQKPNVLVGASAINSYYNYYKKLEKIKDQNKISSTNGFFFKFKF